VKVPSLDDLQTPANGQILLLAKPLSKRAVELAFSAAGEKSSGRPVAKIIREKRQTEDREDFWSSFVCFPIEKDVHFLPGTNLKEKSYGFLLLIETNVDGAWVLGIFKHESGSILDWLENKATPLSRRKLTNAFSDGTSVSKMSIQRMTVSKYELRAASYEAADLKTSLPMMAASRCAVKAIRFNDDIWGSISVSISTSRVQRSGGRCELEDLAELVVLVAEETLENKKSSFLDTFAQAIPVAELPANTEPTSILFDFTDLLEKDELELYKRHPEEEHNIQVNKKILNRLLGEALSLVADGTVWTFAKTPAKPLGTFRATATKYSVASLLGDRLIVYDTRDNHSLSLAKWVRDNNAYSITFTEPELFFGNGALYQRADFSKEIDSVRNCLQVHAALSDATSEKGKPKKDDTEFPTNSIFRAVEESIYQDRDALCCVDLGVEWADYLCIKSNALIFIHCKGAKQTSGATKYQEVVGQALKNLGRTRSSPAEFEAKLKQTEKKEYWAGTKIRRLRDAGQDWENFQNTMLTVLQDPNAGKEVHLVVTMLSLAAFNAAADGPRPPYFVQLIWLLASFIDSCREMGAKPVIVCKP
jgi:hypothetical protein